MTESGEFVGIGVFDDFLGSTSVSMIGSREAFAILAGSLMQELGANEISIDDLLGIRIAQPKLSFTVNSAEEGCYVAEKRKGSFQWFIAPSEKPEVIELLKSLADSEKPCHQYLETTGEIQMIASVDEYPIEVFTQGQ
jgi:hypothetical protein